MLFLWSLVATSASYALLAVWRVSIGNGRDRQSALVAAFVGMSLWALFSLSTAPTANIIGELIQHLGWLAYLADTTRNAPEQTRRAWRRWEATLALLAIGTAIVALFGNMSVIASSAQLSWFLAALAARLVFLIGGLIYLHNLHSDLRNGGRTGVRLILFSVALLWAYDLNLHTIDLLGFGRTAQLLALGKPWVALLLLPSFALAARRREYWKIALSRKATFQSLSLVAIGFYFVGMSLSARAIALFSGGAAPVVGLLLAIVLSVAGVVVILMPRARAWLKVMATKHLFSHRYDYRTEWLRFSATMEDDNDTELTLEERAVKAVADVTESPAGLLLLARSDGEFEMTTVWRWPDQSMINETGVCLPDAILRALEEGLVVTLAPDSLALGSNMGPANAVAANAAGSSIGGSSTGANKAWVAVPLISLSALMGVVILSKPRISRSLDWEDFDLLKVVGRQVAVHLSDAQKQFELEEARRFDEFNRRFSYIIHDIKNVVSQLSLVASNAQQHGSNPKFQADMNRSLASTVEKMTLLLSRLSPDRVYDPPVISNIDIDRLLATISASYPANVAVESTPDVHASGVTDRLKLAMEHLVQNAVESSPADSPVILAARQDGTRCLITVTDHGSGMSGEFMRKGLFKPFVSTKGGGFGIGAAEAKALVEGMGGKLRVSSIEGRGSVFTIELPASSSAG